MILNNAYVMSCNRALLEALATALDVAAIQLTIKEKKLRAIVSTKLAQGDHREAFDAGTLDHTVFANDALNAAVDAANEAAFASMWDAATADNVQWDKDHAKAEPGKRALNVSAKQWIIDLMQRNNEDGTPCQYTLAQLIALTGKTEVNIRTMLSDLRSVRYAGKYGVFNTKATRVNNVTFYSRA